MSLVTLAARGGRGFGTSVFRFFGASVGRSDGGDGFDVDGRNLSLITYIARSRTAGGDRWDATGFGEIIVDVGADGAGSRFAAEGALHGGKDEATFFFGQITIGIEWFELPRLIFGEEIVVFSKRHGFVIEPSRSIEEADVVGRIAFDLALLQNAVDFGEAKLDDGFLKLNAGGEFIDIGGRLAQEAQFSAPLELAEVILIRAVEPVGDVFSVERDAVFSHLELDDFIGAAVVEDLVDQVALMFGKGGDFAFGTKALGG